MNQINKTKVTTQKLKSLLLITGRIVDYHNKLTIAKGEHFNLFSVLKIETREDKTHSAFLAELLNPNGSHQMGDIFLKLFLNVVNYEEDSIEKNNILYDAFNSKEALVTTEFYIGKVDLKNETGGRIDVFLKDKAGNTISIENKIYAKDQLKQIKRYFNYNHLKNKVFYLTLKGSNPEKNSRLNLKSGEHFYNISYREHIVEWLELCLKEVPNFSGLREAINQYILLIKKLTNTMNTENEKELLEIMMANIEESKFIADNYDKALRKLRHNFRENVIEVLRMRLNESNYQIDAGSPVKNKFSQIWIRLRSNPNPYFLFGVESFSGAGLKDGDMFVGIISVKGSPIVEKLPDENRINNSWRQVHFFKTEKLNPINLSHNYTIKILNNKDSKEYKALLNTCCNQIVKFVEDYERKLPKELFYNNME
ncbi:PDDEXK-like family protein [Winogradskyella forsetii]|uniref:PDDEXK-like family protein n=1 Tax=Winogradskyella forsetii TaxID=2686077 RepID=UPI0015B91859|nr:PD-(D/E)XK nuclease family protein [Winogradskyella forsetii]